MGHEMNVPLKFYVHKVALCVSTVRFFFFLPSAGARVRSCALPSFPLRP